MALYNFDRAQQLYDEHVAHILQWIDTNPGGLAADCASACAVPIEIVYYVLEQNTLYDDLPTTSDQFHMRKHR